MGDIWHADSRSRRNTLDSFCAQRRLGWEDDHTRHTFFKRQENSGSHKMHHHYQTVTKTEKHSHLEFSVSA